MTDPVKVLSDDEVAERFNYVGDDAQMVAEPDGEFVRYSDYDALCATVRTLREKYDSLNSKIAWHRDGVGPDVPVLQERYDKLVAERNALRTGLHNIYHVITDEECNAAVALGMATSAVSSLLNQNTALRERLAGVQEALTIISEKKYDVWAFSECVSIAKNALAELKEPQP